MFNKSYIFNVTFLDIAIDDIELNSGECPHYGNCDFEDENFCLWEIERSSNTDWVIGTGAAQVLGKFRAFNK